MAQTVVSSSICILSFLLINFSVCSSLYKERDLKADSIRQKTIPSLDVWKFKGETIKPYLLWKTVFIQIEFDGGKIPDDFVLYQNLNKTQLLLDYEAGQKLFGFFQKWSLWKSTRLHPFSSTYVGVETKLPYDVDLKINTVNFLLVFSFLGGIFLFFSAKKLARNVAAFYVGSSAVCILLSLFIIVFILFRLIPKRPLGLSVLIGGYSFTFYLLYSLWRNLYEILEQYQRFLAVYLVTVGFISFAVCYRLGPARDVRSQNLIQWSIQLSALLLIYNGCQIPEITVTVITVILIIYNIPNSVGARIYKLKYRFFPPKRRLLTEEEYIYQGMVETRKALDELRQFCRSPGCDAWNLSLRLETPKRFASFVSGGSHLNDEELLNHDADSFTDRVEDDSDVSDTEELSSRPARYAVSPGTSFAGRSNSSRYAERYHFSRGASNNINNKRTSLLNDSRLFPGADDFVDDDD